MPEDRLVVLMHGSVAGHVNRLRDDSMEFSYADTYRGAVPLSPALPVGDRRFRDQEIRAYMEGLLPDNADVRQRWARDLETDDTPFSLLAHMGMDCAGAVQFVPDGDVQAALERANDNYEARSDDWIGSRLREVGRADLTASWTMPEEHWSLPGAQGKITLAANDGQWCEAREGSPSTHILKPGVSNMLHQAAVEYATMQVGQRLGLSVARTTLRRFAGQQAIVVERYDRLRTRAGGIRRIHQVDFCQVEGKRPADKYEDNGGSPARTLARMLRRVSSSPETDVRRFSDALLFNYISGSPDGHAKNFSVVYAGRQVRLAPLYDLATGTPYDKNTASHRSSFAIGGVRNFGEAYEKNWIEHAREMGLDPDERLARVRGLLESVPDAFRDVLMHDEALAEQGDVIWRRMTEHPGRLLSHVRQQSQRLRPPPTPVTEPARSQETKFADARPSDLIADTRRALARGERPIVATDQLGREVDRLRELAGSFNLLGADEAARGRRTELLNEAREASTLVLVLASEAASHEPETWVRHLQQLGETGAPVGVSVVLAAQLRLPAFVLLASAGVSAVVAERWTLVDRLLRSLPVESTRRQLEPLATLDELVDSSSPHASIRPDGPAFHHPMALLATYVADVARSAGLLSASDVDTAWDRWEYLWLTARTAAGRRSGVPHLTITSDETGGYVPAARRWARTADTDRERALGWLEPAMVDLDASLIAQATDAAASTILVRGGGGMPGGRWRLDAMGSGRIPAEELDSWRAFLVGPGERGRRGGRSEVEL